MEVERLWHVFTAGLMDALGALRDMETINLAPQSARHLDDPFIVTAGLDQSSQVLRCYAAGPASEPQAVPLTSKQQATLLALGWTAPDRSAEGAERHTYGWKQSYVRQDARERGHAAAMLVATLRQVHGCQSPDDVEAQSSYAGPAVEAALVSLRELLELASNRASIG